MECERKAPKVKEALFFFPEKHLSLLRKNYILCPLHEDVAIFEWPLKPSELSRELERTRAPHDNCELLS